MSVRAYLISETQFNDGEAERFLADEGTPPLSESVISRKQGFPAAVSIVEMAARLCYMSFGRGRTSIPDFIRNLIEHKHGSVFEHAVYGIILAGVSRSFTHELVRHRAGFAYSQLSQRYVDAADTEFVTPPAVRESPEALKKFNDAVERARSAYADMATALSESEGVSGTAARKSVREAARSVLPNATETKIFVTGNVRAWRHFIEMRGSEYADAEMREVALAVLALLREQAPSMFYDFSEVRLSDGKSVVRVDNSKI